MTADIGDHLSSTPYVPYRLMPYMGDVGMVQARLLDARILLRLTQRSAPLGQECVTLEIVVEGVISPLRI